MRRTRFGLPIVSLIVLILVVLSGCSSGKITTMGAAPVITAQPAGATVTVGQTATFTAAASGTAPVSFQWRKNTANISGATSASYTTPATASGDNGAKFDVMASNAYGSATSNAATLVVNPAPTLQSIAISPSAPTVAVGKTQQFSAVGMYSDNSTKTITTSVTWKSSNTAFATIGANTGLATGVAAGTTQITATLGNVVSPQDALKVTAVVVTLQSIAVTPATPTVGVGQPLQFTATGTYSDNSMSNITTSAAWASSDSSIATIGLNNGLAVAVAAGTTQITAALSGVTSPNDLLMVTAMVSSAPDVVTHHYDISRTGTNAHETTLTPANVKSSTFGKVGEFTVDGQIDGQILYLNQVAITGQGNKNVLYFATENDSVYAVDADSVSSTAATVLWKTSALGTGEVPLTPSDIGCGNINPVGIMSSPVIDRGRNAIYVVATSKDGKGGFFHRLHALDLTTGKELFGGPTTITATFPGSGGNSQGGTVTFLPVVQEQRAALLESGGAIYTAWSGYYGDCGNYSAWVISYNADTLARDGAIDLVPNTHGAGIWLGGAGPAADSSGDVYMATGNAFGGNTPGMNSNYGDTFVKLSGTAPLTPLDYFAPSNAILDDQDDADFGSSGPLLLPDLVDSSQITRHLAVVAGKDGTMYVVNRDNMGHYDATTNNVYQEFASDGHENFSAPVFFNTWVYLAPSGLPIRAYSVTNALLSSAPTSLSGTSFGGSGAEPSVSSNGNTNGIVWALDYSSGVLHAYDATDLSKELYNSSQAAANRDHFAAVGGHFITPMVTGGKVYIGTQSSVVVFGLLP